MNDSAMYAWRDVDERGSRPVWAWDALGFSVQGAYHRHIGRPNEDAFAIFPEQPRTLPKVIGVADGVGSQRCVRSAEGARLAVRTATAELQRALVVCDGLDLPVLEQMLVDGAPQLIARAWEEAVELHFAANPLTEDEIQQYLAAPDQPNLEQLQHRAAHMYLYCTTLLAVAVTEQVLIYLQLGDGDILVVSSSSAVQQPVGALSSGGVLTSGLGIADTWRTMQVHIEPRHTSSTTFALLATDGCRNSFQSDGDFYQVGTDLLAALRSTRAADLSAAIPSWLNTLSLTGSADDITIGLVYCTDDLPLDS